METSDDFNAPTAPGEEHSFASFRREGILFGRFGLRAGWGMAAYIAIWFVVSIVVSIIALGATGELKRAAEARASHHEAHVDFTPLFVILNDGLPMLAMLAASALFARGERRPIEAYGIGKNRWKDFFPGAFWGLLILSALVGTLYASHLLKFDGLALAAGPATLYGCKWLLAFLLVGGAEEYFFRGYLQYTLMRGLWGLGERLSPLNPRPYAFWSAATLLSFIFAALHGSNGGETRFGLLTVFLAGMTFAYALWRTGSLWWAIGFHAAWDWAQSFLYGVPDSGNVSVGRLFITHPAGDPMLSGGSDGPEGSLFVIVALLVTIAVVHFTPRGEQPRIEQMPENDALPQESNAAIS